MMQNKSFEVLDGEQLQPYFDAIELEGTTAQPMDEGVEEGKVSLTSGVSSWRLCEVKEIGDCCGLLEAPSPPILWCLTVLFSELISLDSPHLTFNP